VEAVHGEHAVSKVADNGFHLVLVNTEHGVPATLEMCRRMKAARPEVRVAILAHGSENIPHEGCIDVVIRVQYSPAKFIGAINTLLESPEGQKHS
jgi:hypothetical protein